MSNPTGRPQQKHSGIIKAPASFRFAQIAVGIITLVLAGIVLAFPGFAIFLVAIWLSLSLFFGGIESIIVGAGARHLSKAGRAISIGLGAVTVGLSIAVFAFPVAAAITVVVLLSIALLFLGAGAIAKGITESRSSRIPGWARMMLVAVGAITVGLSIAVMAFPVSIGMFILFALVATALIINGASYITAGVTGAIFFWPVSDGRLFGGGSNDTATRRNSWGSDST